MRLVTLWVGVGCSLCVVVAGKSAYDYYDVTYNVVKNSAKAINSGSKKIKEEFLKQLSF